MRLSQLATAAALLVMVAAPLGGCGTVSAYLGGAAGDTVQGHTTASAQDANDLGTAELLATAAFTAADQYVQAVHPSVGTLVTIRTYKAKIYAELLSLRAAHARGESLSFTAFNDALHAWLAWKAQNGSSQ